MGKQKQFNEEEVLEIIANYFWEHGFNATKVDKIAEITNLTKSSLYNAFGNKEAIFLKIIDFYINKYLDFRLKYIDLNKSLYKNLENLLKQIFLNDENEHLSKGCLLTNSILELSSNKPKLYNEVIKQQNKIRNSMHEIFSYYVKNNLLSSKINADELTDFYMVFFQGLRVQSRNTSNKNSLQNAINTFIKIIISIEK